MESLEEISKKIGVPVSKLEALCKINLEELKRYNVGKSDSELIAFAMEKTVAQLVKAKLKSANEENFEGVILGYTRLNDQAAIRRAQVAKLSKEEAIAQKLINSQGQILDNFGNVMSSDMFTRIIYGICKRDSDTVPRRFVMWANRDAAKVMYPKFTLISFKASVNVAKTSNEVYVLSTSSGSFEKLNQTTPLVIDELVKTYLPNSITTLDKVYDWSMQYGADRNNFFVTEARIMEIDSVVNQKSGTKKMSVNYSNGDIDYTAMCWLPEGFEEYPVLSKVMLFGQLNGKLDTITRENLTINVLGMYPIDIVNIEANAIDTSSISEPSGSEFV